MVERDRGEVGRDEALRRELQRDTTANLLLRLDRRIAIHKDGRCWVWLGSHDEEGYARVWWQGRNWHLTRALMTAILGRDLKPHEEVHHTCEHNWCCHPDHMEVLPWWEHLRRHGWRRRDEREEEAAD